MAALGMDFGTSTTAMVDARTGQFVRSGQGHEVVPTALAFLPSQRVEFGFAAKARLLIDAPNTLHSFKRILGLPMSHPTVRRFVEQYPHFVFEAGPDGMPRFVTRAGTVSAVQAVARFLHCFRELEPLCSHPPAATSSGITVTAGKAERAALCQAIEQAGFGNVGLIEEPYAAAAAYLVDAGGIETKERRIFVYDLGGGTFDAAVILCQGKKLRMLGTLGDAYLGGEDIDARLADWAARRILEEHHWDVRTSAAAQSALLSACERSKIRLSELDATTLDLGSVDPVLAGKNLHIDRPQLERLFGDLVRRTFIITDELMRQTSLHPSDIDVLVLSGGCIHIPAIRRGVEHYMQKASKSTVSPDRLCAMGVLLHASQRDNPGFEFAAVDPSMLG